VSHWLGGMLLDPEARRAHGRILASAASKLGEPGVHLRAAKAISDLLNS
jgi:hypothetical protein